MRQAELSTQQDLPEEVASAPNHAPAMMGSDMQQIDWLFSLDKFHMWHITSSHKCSK